MEDILNMITTRLSGLEKITEQYKSLITYADTLIEVMVEEKQYKAPFRKELRSVIKELEAIPDENPEKSHVIWSANQILEGKSPFSGLKC